MRYPAEEMSHAGLDGLEGQLFVVTTPDGPRELGIPAGVRVLTEQGRAVSQALSVVGTPFAITVDPDGIVTGTGVPNTLQQLTSLAAGD